MFSAVIVMSGVGSRLGQKMNKVLLPLGDKPLFMHSVDTFLNYDCEIILVVNQQDFEVVKNMVKDNPSIIMTQGGKTRQESVYNGLTIATGEYVLIHDAARPFINSEIIDEILNNLNPDKAFLVASKVKDTIKENKEGQLITLNRSNLLQAQTPQGGLLKTLRYVHEMAKLESFEGTDDISLVEKFSDTPLLVIPGNDYNFKITTEFDYKIAQIIVKEVMGLD